MRTLEILIPILLTIYVLFPLITGKSRPRPVTSLPLLAMLLGLLHLLFEGYRWQMIPLYTLTGTLTFTAIPTLLKNTNSAFKRLSWTGVLHILTLILLAVSTALPALLPVPIISTPGGNYQVGTQIFTLTDTSRTELYSGQEEPRRFMIQVWYPANPSTQDSLAPWMKDARIFARAIATYLELPAFFLDHLELVKTPAYLNAELDPGNKPYPVILFSHGWNGFAAQNANQALELASRGYVVVGMQHTYGAIVTVFPDGTIAPNNPNALPDGVPADRYNQAARTLADQWASDMAFTLDFLQAQNEDTNSPFHTALELNKVGVYGHSTGGGAAIQFCGTDSRCTALLSMDPFMTPVSSQVLHEGVSQPSFHMFSQTWANLTDSKNNRLFYSFYEQLDPATRVIYIRDTAHYDFSDLPLLSPIAPQLGLKGPINGKRVNQIVNDYLISFFEMTLKDKPFDLFTTQISPYPEVVYTR
ncbi:MAG: carboxylic ester hydrolase [Anaerolineales bacterium]